MRSVFALSIVAGLAFYGCSGSETGGTGDTIETGGTGGFSGAGGLSGEG
jgi:hypothetical protein